jgi:hypothetical protein
MSYLSYARYQDIHDAVSKLESGEFKLNGNEEVRNALEATVRMVGTILTNTNACNCDECHDRLDVVGKWLIDIGAMEDSR